MLAEIEQRSSLNQQVADSDPPVISLTLSFDADTGQFTWGGGTQTSAENIAGVINVTQQTIVQITLTTSNTVFNSTNPVSFISNQNNFNVLPGSGGSNQLSFTVIQPPTSFFSPLMLSFNVDTNSVNGISSPLLFMALSANTTTSPPSTTVSVQYSANGSFTLIESGIPLASQVLLINAIALPLQIKFKLSTLPAGLSVTFNSDQSNMPSTWNPTVDPNNPQQLDVEIPSSASKFSSFQFSIKVNDVTVLSPDPILVNATIGDGSGN